MSRKPIDLSNVVNTKHAKLAAVKNEQTIGVTPTVNPLSLQRESMNKTRRMHYIFTVLYGIAMSIIVASSIIWINFWTTFQSGALALNVGIAFLLFASTIVGRMNMKNIMDEFVIYKKCAILIGMTCIIAIIFSLFPLYNTIHILTKCPSYTTTTGVSPHGIITNTSTTTTTTTTNGNQNKFRLESAYDDPLKKTSADPIYLELMAQEICLHEYSFAIFWSIFIILLILLNIGTIACYAWIKTV
jgi:hypothetical protein